MRLLADENFPRLAVLALRERGHDVLWVRTEMRGATDITIIARAVVEQRILLTFDKDFGELVFRHRLPVPSGVILFRMPPMSSRDVARLPDVSALEGDAHWVGYFSVVEEHRIRRTPLPPPLNGNQPR